MSSQFIFTLNLDLSLIPDENVANYLSNVVDSLKSVLRDGDLRDTVEKFELEKLIEVFLIRAGYLIMSFSLDDFIEMVRCYTRIEELLYKLAINRETVRRTRNVLKNVIDVVLKKYAKEYMIYTITKMTEIHY